MEQRKELNRTYIRIGLMFLAWGVMIALRAMIVIPDKPTPIVFEYHRPEKIAEKKVDQRDTIFLISVDWMFPYNFQYYSYPWNGCGGVIYWDAWNPGFMIPGYGFPSYGGYPLGEVITLPRADSTSTDSLKIENQDSLFNTTNDTNAGNQMAQVNINSSQRKEIGKRLFVKLNQVKINRKIRKERRSERRKD